jgi:hypothetical protein
MKNQDHRNKEMVKLVKEQRKSNAWGLETPVLMERAQPSLPSENPHQLDSITEPMKQECHPPECPLITPEVALGSWTLPTLGINKDKVASPTGLRHEVCHAMREGCSRICTYKCLTPKAYSVRRVCLP